MFHSVGGRFLSTGGTIHPVVSPIIHRSLSTGGRWGVDNPPTRPQSIHRWRVDGGRWIDWGRSIILVLAIFKFKIYSQIAHLCFSFCFRIDWQPFAFAYLLLHISVPEAICAHCTNNSSLTINSLTCYLNKICTLQNILSWVKVCTLQNECQLRGMNCRN